LRLCGGGSSLSSGVGTDVFPVGSFWTSPLEGVVATEALTTGSDCFTRFSFLAKLMSSSALVFVSVREASLTTGCKCCSSEACCVPFVPAPADSILFSSAGTTSFSLETVCCGGFLSGDFESIVVSCGLLGLDSTASASAALFSRVASVSGVGAVCGVCEVSLAVMLPDVIKGVDGRISFFSELG